MTMPSAQATITVLTSGVVGVILTTLIAVYRGRRHRVGFRVKVLSLAPQLEGWQFFPRISIQNQLQMRVDVSSLDLAKIEVINQSSSKDFTEFCFGITLPGDIAILDVKTSSEDEDHLIERRERPGQEAVDSTDIKVRLGQIATIPANAMHKLDFRIYPFNRGEVYTVEIATTPNPALDQYSSRGNPLVESSVRLSTPEVGVKLKKIEREFSVEKYQPSVTLLQRTWIVVFLGVMVTILYLALSSIVTNTMMLALVMVSILFVLALTIVVIPMSKRMV